MSKFRTLAAVAAASSVGAAAGSAGSASASDADRILATRPPVQLHPLATATRSVLADNVIKLLAPQSRPTTGGPSTNGEFGLPFAEPTVNGQTTAAKCVKAATPNGGAKGPVAQVCKPAAGTLVNLPNGKVLFWDALEGTENNTFSIVAEGGATFTNDSARLLSGAESGKPVWTEPKPFDGGANPDGNPGRPLIPGLQTTEKYNDGALFGSHQAFLPDGRLLVQGGTDYSLDPGIDGIPFGAVELTGLKATRIYDPKTNAFTQTGDSAYRRWYPTLVETGDGKYINFSGVGKLLKPVYLDEPQDSLTNVKQVEQFDPATEKWKTFPKTADFDLPLYPRMHLLPNGRMFYNAAGQAFNPFGQSVGETNWNEVATFDPKTATWKKLALANTKTLAPGFRGSTSSTLLPLKPDADGSYTKASFLTAGGVLLPSPGSYFATDQSSITTVDTAGGGERVTQQKTGSLNQVRWFGQNIVLPTGEVVVFSGGDKDEVVGPGTEFPVQQAELFDPVRKTWKPIATAHNPRTYHNSAVLLPSGEVLVGGHATISTAYLNNTTLPGGFAPHDGRDPSFEVFKPPYLFRGARPVISKAPAKVGYGKSMVVTMKTAKQAATVDTVSLVRNSAITHIVDADQRSVQLRVISHKGRRVKLAGVPSGNVAPPGPYMLFVNRTSSQGPVPSVAKQVMVG
ncbi:hypothetical protein DSM112329_01861 [Paraconexibacter sp. AEG42_29]|uniref:Galactose oxidase-like Early set domain-containing protein n=1 Tax=Paraconexibacter sp. AEG42_29 TaxID=2997339 RepID=A0AAU7ATN4_9ACTN